MSAMNSSSSMRQKKPLIEAFLAVVNGFDDVIEGWYEFVKSQKEIALSEIIQSEKLKPEETKKFIEDSFESAVSSKGLIYDLNGKVVGSGLEMLKQLPQGIYIYNNRKYMNK